MYIAALTLPPTVMMVGGKRNKSLSWGKHTYIVVIFSEVTSHVRGGDAMHVFVFY